MKKTLDTVLATQKTNTIHSFVCFFCVGVHCPKLGFPHFNFLPAVIQFLTGIKYIKFNPKPEYLNITNCTED